MEEGGVLVEEAADGAEVASGAGLAEEGTVGGKRRVGLGLGRRDDCHWDDCFVWVFRSGLEAVWACVRVSVRRGGLKWWVE